MTLLAGSYERFLFGLRISQGQEGSEQHTLARSFTHAAHKGIVKCIAAAGQWAATGGADDLIHLYDLKNDKDLGFLMSPGEGAVTALAFFAPAGGYNPTHLLSGSADGSVSVWAAGGGWESMKTMRGHRREVTAIAVHPSGLAALTTSRDCCLRMWDLVKGRCTYTSKLEGEAEAVAFSTEDGGERYALLCGARVTLHSVQGGQGVLCTLSHPRRVLCMAWAPGNRLVTGSEDGSLRLWDAQAGVELLCINRAHSSRVRALALVDSGGIDSSGSGGSGGGSGGSGGEAGQPLLVSTCSSDGSVKLWDLSKAAAAGVPTGASGGSCLGEAQTRARLTCLAAVDAVPMMRRRQAAAAAARQQAARAAAAQQPQQQQDGEQEQGSKKRKGGANPVGGAAQAGGGGGKKHKKEEAAARQQQQQKQPRPGKAKAGKAKAGGSVEQAAAPGGDGVVVHDGVVEFLDSPEQAKKQQQKAAAVQQKRRAAAEQGKRFRSVPGEAAPKRPQGRSPGGARPKQRQQQKGKGGSGKFKPRR